MKKIASIGIALAIGFGGMAAMAAPAQAATASNTVKKNFNEGWKKQGCGSVNLKVENAGKLPYGMKKETRFSFYQSPNSTKTVALRANNKKLLNNKSEMKKVGAQTCYYHLVYSTYGKKNANSQLAKKFNSKNVKHYSTRGSATEKAVVCMGKARGIASFSMYTGSCSKKEIANAKKILSGRKA